MRKVACEILTSGTCPLDCKYCVGKGTLILMGNLLWKPIEKIREGENIIGVRQQEKGGRYQFIKTKVIATNKRLAKTIKIETNKGSIICTPEHKWLRKHHGFLPIFSRHLTGWRVADIKWIGCPYLFKENEQYKKGWLAGMILGDGCLIDKNYPYWGKQRGEIGKGSIQTAQKIRAFALVVKDKEILDRFKEYSQLNFHDFIHNPDGLLGIRTNKEANYLKLKRISERETNNYDWNRGFLGGIFDAEGCYSRGILRISQKEGKVLDKIKKILTILNISFAVESYKSRIKTVRIRKQENILLFFSLTNPVLKRKKADFFNHTIYGNAEIQGIRKYGIKEIYNLRTESENYIANGLISHNCYIPKTPKMKKLHQEITEDLASDDLISRLKKVYGDSLEYLGFWGTEPTLTLEKLTEKISHIKREFPKLRQISFTTNLIMGVEKIVDLARACDKEEVRLEIQISLDGPEWITDKQRNTGVTKKVVKNYASLLARLGEDKPKTRIEIRFKPTLGIEFITLMADDIDKTVEWFRFFDELISRGKKTLEGCNARIVPSAYPSLVVPGKYTAEDGKNLARFFETLHQVEITEKFQNYSGSLNTYYLRWDRVGRYGHEFYIKSSMFTCSGGDSQLGLGIKDDVHICHRSYYLNYQEYRNSILRQKDIENWDVSLLKRGLLKKLTDSYIVDLDNEKEVTRFNYVMRSYHDFTKLRMSSVNVMLIELALAGQASPIYLRSEEIRRLFCVFMNSCMTCPAENLLNTGVVHLTPVSLIRLFANGAFETILKYYCKEANF